MDSLTQIILGASVGEVVLGKKIGNKALLYGAIAGTIPDLDVFASFFTDTVTALAIHRGFTHSVLFSIVFAPVFGWIVNKYERYKNFKSWSLLFFLAFLTHPILDAFTTWGTQLFWPLDIRLAFKTIFVIDPLYTLPFLLCLIIVMFYKRHTKKRHFYNILGLSISSIYLCTTLIFKHLALEEFKNALQNQNIKYKQIDTRPSPLNTILWSANIETENNYLLANYSFFDTKPITFYTYNKNHELIKHLEKNKKVQKMIAISNGWYTISKKDDSLFYNDLRFGLLDLEPESQAFVFKYKIEKDENGIVSFTEQEKNKRDAKKLMQNLWKRVKGN
ncbi:metal-dependent hydrolase [Lacinutrix sp. 5H-3-7-4]|uniref:metal-dependent hydrolase n=1 Tax=Lacinutrix sp. (strain 5H-3-7-4) TaxID=983544 RepID=UPI00020A34F6|nr:metal-dependent hydrolase [Lacinutrix sp. 5H-3-7-4]AEH02655.1 Protein of unknown function DUF457, transmembrane [Lacinutrix sp. 5H-3-7-4]